MSKKISRKNIKTPQEALDYSMNVLRGPYKHKDRELEILSQDPLICLFYVRYVLLPDYAIPDIIFNSITKDKDVNDIFKATVHQTRNMYKKIEKIMKKGKK